MRKLKISRGNGFYGKYRALKLVVDGKEVGHISRGETIEIEVPSDAVELRG